MNINDKKAHEALQDKILDASEVLRGWIKIAEDTTLHEAEFDRHKTCALLSMLKIVSKELEEASETVESFKRQLP